MYDKMMLIRYRVEFEGELYTDTCLHHCIRLDSEGDCIDSDSDIIDSIKYNSDGKVIDWEFVKYLNIGEMI